VPIVFDPVMVATSGAELADAETIAAFERLMSLASVVTPNLPNWRRLEARPRCSLMAATLLAKGGHAEGDWLVDRLLPPMARSRGWRPRGSKRTTRTAPAAPWRARLRPDWGAGLPIKDAFVQAIRFVRIAILSAPGLGQGHGPLGHHLDVVPFDEIEGSTFESRSD
jgi:hydroxymethylpyrimidine/phosphomethylpyrimidine kinase